FDRDVWTIRTHQISSVRNHKEQFTVRQLDYAFIMQVGYDRHCANLLRNSLALACCTMTGRAVDREALLTALQQGGGDREWIVVDEICGSNHTASIHGRIFERVNGAACGLNRRAASDRAGDRKLGTEAIRKEAVFLLWPELELKFHVREDIKWRL